MPIKKFRTTILIDDDKFPNDDWAFIKTRHFKPTNLLRAKVKELREREEGKPTTEQLLENIKNMQEKMKQLFSFLEQKELLDDFFKERKNLNN